MHQATYTAVDVFFTSDTHFGHANILRYCDRPFGSIKEHDEALLQRAWETVGAEAVLIHLGDVAFGREAAHFVDRLPGATRILVAGNHDEQKTLEAPGWDRVVPYLELTLTGGRGGSRRLVLSHYPFEVWNGGHKGVMHLHGHSHGRLPSLLKDRGGSRLDVGVDCFDYRPVSLEDVEARLTEIRAGRADGRAPYAVARGQTEER